MKHFSGKSNFREKPVFTEIWEPHHNSNHGFTIFLLTNLIVVIILCISIHIKYMITIKYWLNFNMLSWCYNKQHTKHIYNKCPKTKSRGKKFPLWILQPESLMASLTWSMPRPLHCRMITSSNFAAWHSASSPATPVRTWSKQNINCKQVSQNI